MKRALLLLSFSGLTLAGVWLRPQQEPEFTVHEVRGSISYLEGVGGNIGLLNGEDGFLLVDTQLARFEDGVVGAIADYLDMESTLATAAPLYLVNTHWHGDHVGNNAPFGRSRVPIVAHDNVRARMVPEDGVEGRTQAAPKEALPTLTYGDSLRMHFGDERIEVQHYPAGHTDGDSVVFFETSKVVHCGDLFFESRFPFIDSGSGGTPRGYLAAVDGILARIDDTWRVIPGHGALTDQAGLQAFRDMLATCIERVQKALDAGQTVEEMIEAELLGDFAKTHDWQFINQGRFLGDLATGLSQ